MVIKKISCEQFAGIHDRSVEFSDGLNILLGPNEAGKSTLVDLMYQLLFQDVKIRRNSDFQKQYFPQTTGSVQADCVDGSISFETADGRYTLQKEWQNAAGSCKLRMPDGAVIRDTASIGSVLAEVLEYGQGVYDEMVFASQKRAMTVLQALFQGAKTATDVRDELTATVTKAVMETGGISIEKMQSRIADYLKQYGERWDEDADMPEGGKKRGIENKWSCAATSGSERAVVLRAWYAMEEIRKKLSDAKEAEQHVDEASKDLENARMARKAAGERQKRFSNFRAVLESRQSIGRTIDSAEREEERLAGDARAWPVVLRNKSRAEALQTAQRQAACKALYKKVAELKSQLAEKEEEMQKIGSVSEEDAGQTEELERKIENLEAQLRGLNLTARLRQLGSAAPVVRSVSTGEDLDFSGENFIITEAVDIIVPGVMELRLTPKGIDAEKISADLAEARKKYAELRSRYGVTNAAELRGKQRRYSEAERAAKNLKNDIERELNGTDWETLKGEYAALPDEVEDAKIVAGQVRVLCGTKTLEAYIGAQDGIIGQYKENYGSQEKLAEQIRGKAAEIEENRKKLDSLESVPEEYSNISDVDDYAKQLETAVTDCDKVIEKCLGSLNDAENKLGDCTAEEYAEQLEEAKQIFEEKKQTYARWKRIREVVDRVKEAMSGNPMQDIEENFCRYLSLLSDGNIAAGEMDEHMSTQLTSGRNRLTYETLSEGTRDTVALAFRLAVLKHLFPNGGGLAVFDDPFTDMDPVRTEQACRLISEFAKDNQVIFVTCDEKYKALLSGNVVEIGK